MLSRGRPENSLTAKTIIALLRRRLFTNTRSNMVSHISAYHVISWRALLRWKGKPHLIHYRHSIQVKTKREFRLQSCWHNLSFWPWFSLRRHFNIWNLFYCKLHFSIRGLIRNWNKTTGIEFTVKPPNNDFEKCKQNRSLLGGVFIEG